MPSLTERFKRSWNAFVGRDPTPLRVDYGFSTSRPLYKARFTRGNERSVVSSIYNQIAVDVASTNIRHCIADENGNFTDYIPDSSLNYCFTDSANIDQTGRELILDATITMFDEGHVALVPVTTDVDPRYTDAFNVQELRVGIVKEWMPRHVKVEVYNDRTGRRQELILEKRFVAVVQNPFYSIMNEPNSTLQRLIRVLNQIDRLNEQNSSGKLDLIIQLPYPIRSKARQNDAEARRKEVEAQLVGSQYGIAYIDGTEKIVQLNRSLENNLWLQATDLTAQLYNQLGMSEKIFNGTANESELLNYFDRTIEPILNALCEGMRVKFLSKNARTRGQTIMYFMDQFKLAPLETFSKAADTLTRNAILSTNEVRAILGMKPSQDPEADALRNKNLKIEDSTSSEFASEIQNEQSNDDEAVNEERDRIVEDLFKSLEDQIDEIIANALDESDEENDEDEE